MAEKRIKEVTYKSQITHLLLNLLEIAGRDTQYAENFEEAYRKRLQFQKQTDWKRFRASVDLLDDTESAIQSVFRYQLGDLSNNNKDCGEMNLRLYGILNAVYLQMSAYKVIANLLNYPERDNITSFFEQLDIYKLRGIAGAHTVDYTYDKQTLVNQKGIHKKTSFRVVQMHLENTGRKITVLDENNITYEFNLLKILAEYEKLATDLLVRLITHSINSLVNTKEDKAFFRDRLKELLPNLMDYSKLDQNKKYWDNLINSINRTSKRKYKELILEELDKTMKKEMKKMKHE